MSEPTLHHVNCASAAGQHRMAYWQWGDEAAAHVVLCVHGLTRQGRDFDTLAQALLQRAGGPLRVICPDVVGRGRSDWLSEPAGYQIPTYAADMLALIAQLHGQAAIAQLDWVGTSMGGLIGMVLTGAPGLPLPVPFRHLVINDVGPVIEWVALQRIGEFLGNFGTFATEQEGADAMWRVASSFGPHTSAEWLALSRPMLKALPEGGFTLHYDPAISLPFRALSAELAADGEAALWQLYDQISAQTLLIRGAESDLLSEATAQAMTSRGPKASLVEFAGVGHAPTLVAEEQQNVVLDFLLGAP